MAFINWTVNIDSPPAKPETLLTGYDEVGIPNGADWNKVYQRQLEPWTPEPEERFLIPNSFLTDFCLAYRGYEAPLIFWIWGALFSVSSILKRHAWFQFGHDRQFPNLYLMYVAPPGIAKKSTVVNASIKTLRNCVEYMEHPKTKALRNPHIINDATEEAMHKELMPRTKSIYWEEEDEDGITRTHSEDIQLGSNGIITLNEMTTLISKKKYQSGIVTKLTSLYDCLDADERTTISHGKERLENIFVNFVAATTPGAIETQFPEDAMSGGLMSRMVTVYAQDSPRMYPMPMIYEGVPSPEDLAKRLAWIADTAVGEYRLTEEAYQYYATVLYPKIKFFQKEGGEEYRGANARMEILLQKIAIILRASEYRRGCEVSLEHLRMAWDLLNHSLSTSYSLFGKLSETESFQHANRIMRLLKKYDKVTYRQLATRTSKWFGSKELRICLWDLHNRGALQVLDKGDEEKQALSFHRDESYIYVPNNPYDEFLNEAEHLELEESYNKTLEE